MQDILLENVDRILSSPYNSTVLTIGETEDFADAGVVITFVIVDNKVRFEVDLSAAERAGLQISSRMLSLATRVRLSEGQ